MSAYIYTFISEHGYGEAKEIEAYNLFNGAKKLGIEITRADRHTNCYLASTPFDKRERFVWEGMKTYLVKQRRKIRNNQIIVLSSGRTKRYYMHYY